MSVEVIRHINFITADLNSPGFVNNSKLMILGDFRDYTSGIGWIGYCSNKYRVILWNFWNIFFENKIKSISFLFSGFFKLC